MLLCPSTLTYLRCSVLVSENETQHISLMRLVWRDNSHQWHVCQGFSFWGWDMTHGTYESVTVNSSLRKFYCYNNCGAVVLLWKQGRL